MHNSTWHLKMSTLQAHTLSQTNPSFLAHGEAGSSTDRQKEAQEHRYSGELRAKIAKYAIENGNKAEIHIDLGYTFQSHSQTSNKCAIC